MYVQKQITYIYIQKQHLKIEYLRMNRNNDIHTHSTLYFTFGKENRFFGLLIEFRGLK